MTYQYPDAEYWIHYLDPIDATYLVLFAIYRNDQYKGGIIDCDIVYPGKDSKGNRRMFELDDDRDHHEIDGGSLIIGYEDIFTVDLAGSYSGGFSKYYPGTWNDPPEGGDPELNDVTVESICYNTEEDELIEISPAMVKDKDYTYKDLDALAEGVMQSMISAEPQYTIKHMPKTIPNSIEEKIKQILADNKSNIRSKKVNKRFGL